MSAPNVTTSATITFNTTTYKVESLPHGKSRTSEAVDVTCCDDPRKQYVPGALKTNEDIEVVIGGDAKPDINTKAALTITNNSTTVTVGDCVVQSVKPTDITTENASRKVGWTVVFRPCGANPPANNG